MKIDIGINIEGKNKGLMGVSLEEIKSASIKKKKKKKKSLMKAIESAIPKKSKYTTEVV